MQLTIIGAVQFLLGLLLFVFGSVRSLFAFVMFSMLFGGSAAVVLSSLGGSSIAPAHFALAFLLLRCLIPGSVSQADILASLRSNGWLIAFVLYGLFAAIILPRLFAGQIEVTPLRGQLRPRYGTQLARILAAGPLRFSPQNITTAVYMTGTLLMAIAAQTVLRGAGASRVLVRTAAVVGGLHALLGFASVVLKNTPANAILDLFRNGSYAQLDHEYQGFVRMNGLWPEASSFAAFAVIWFIFNFECWLRGVESRFTGPAALLLGSALLASTSSSAYVGLALFAGLLAVRMLVTPSLFRLDKVGWLVMAGLFAVIMASVLLILNPVLVASLRGLVEHMTLDKADSFSGRQRLFWATQGLDAFRISFGLGIGPGSFRSSSLIAAIIGSLGVVGVVTFAGHVIRAFKPLALSTYLRTNDPERNIGGAAAWAMMFGVFIASISAPSCDPGLEFAILSAAAMALRSARRPASEAESEFPAAGAAMPYAIAAGPA